MEKHDPQRPKRLKQIIDSIADDYESIKGNASQVSQVAGYSADALRKIGSDVEKMPDDPLLEETERELKLHRELTRKQAAGSRLTLTDVSSGANVILSDTLSTTSAVMMTVGDPGIRRRRSSLAIDLPGLGMRQEVYAQKLAAFDPEIARVYKSIPEIFFGTKENPERAALYQMRQAYDHFFDKLAPDGEVRNSEYFTPKEEPGKENSVHRIERIKYAAYTRLSMDKDQADALVSSATSLLATYDRLQAAHKRAPLDREAVRDWITAMRAQLERWIDAVAPKEGLAVNQLNGDDE